MVVGILQLLLMNQMVERWTKRLTLAPRLVNFSLASFGAAMELEISNANGTSNDFITCATTSQSGLRFEIHSDGTRMHATGWARDASDTLFADAAG